MFPALHGPKKLPSFGPDVGHPLMVGRPNNNDGDGNITGKVKSLCSKLYRDYLISVNSQDFGNFLLELNSNKILNDCIEVQEKKKKLFSSWAIVA